MKVPILLACLIAAAMGAEFMEKTMTHMDYLWDEWKATYGRNYPNECEDSFRRAIWENNVEFVDQHNAEHKEGKQSYTVAINHFSDKTPEEMSQMFGLMPNNNTDLASEYYVPGNFERLPSSVDWRTRGWVTPVKDQGETCSSCWAFTAIGALEGQHAKKYGSLVSLSEQNLVDCSRENLGCLGGWVYEAFNYVIKNGGVDTEESYPYENKQGKCRFNKKNTGGTCRSFHQTKSGSEHFLQKGVANVGPIGVSIHGSLQSFVHYSSGVYDDTACSKNHLDHAVLAIGYGKESGKDYWLIKNSWGTDWGEKGYGKMRRNRDNQCGIACDCYYPIL